MPARLRKAGASSGRSTRRTNGEAGLARLQRLTARAIFRPLDRNRHTQRTWIDGGRTADVVAQFIKPNDRLTSLERLEIYNRQYWFRVLDCLYDDYPGLRAILGERKFYNLRVAYLSRYPSASFTLRDLGSRLERFLTEEQRWTRPHDEICLEMSRFEWAQIVAFDGPAKPALAPGDLQNASPAKLRLRLQPYMTLLELNWPLDEFVIAAKKRDVALRSEASNAMIEGEAKRAGGRLRLPRRQKIFTAVHRYQNDLYYKRLDAVQYRLLCGMRDGLTLGRACERAFDGAEDAMPVGQVQEWFREWTELGWFCKRA